MVLLDTGTPGISREIYIEDADGETPGIASSSLTIGILTVNFSIGTKSSCVHQNHCTSRMRSQSQLRNDKYIMRTKGFCIVVLQSLFLDYLVSQKLFVYLYNFHRRKKLVSCVVQRT